MGYGSAMTTDKHIKTRLAVDGKIYVGTPSHMEATKGRAQLPPGPKGTRVALASGVML